ncbi:MAG TPA: amidase [Vicinamibacteria bacterium]|nr:amidase [Vicinamibacteria bacterium]
MKPSRGGGEARLLDGGERTAGARRRFLACFAGTGLSATLLPGALWARWQEAGTDRVTLAMLREAVHIAGLDFTEDEQRTMLRAVNRNLRRADELHQVPLANSVPSPTHFDPRVPGAYREAVPGRMRATSPGRVRRPARLEEAAFWPLTHLAALVRTRQVSAVELLEMYLGRIERYEPKLNCVVTLTLERAREQARRLDRELSAGRYRGPLHGLPWGAKDIIAARGYPTTWGAAPFQTQVFDEDATVVKRLDEAGAVLLAKLSTGELAFGDQWFRGRTNSPWNPEEGSSGSSAGSAAATAAGLVAFALGTDTGGSILAPSIRCGVAGLRPTFGRVSRTGVMAAGWTLDKVGPMGRTAEDCALVLHAIAGPDGQDLAVHEGAPFHWEAAQPVAPARVGYVAAMLEAEQDPAFRANTGRALESLRAAGCELRPIELPRSDLCYYIEYVERAAGFDDFTRERRDAGLRNERHRGDLRAFHLVSAVDYLQANRVRTLLMQDYARITADLDVVFGGRATLDPATSLNPVTSLTGHPVVALRSGFSAAGTPTGVTLAGRLYDEGRLLAVARVVERSVASERRPVLD